jgi:hypothetical protein
VRVSERIRVSQTTVLSAMNAKRVERSSTRFCAMANWRVTVRSSYLSEPLPRKALKVKPKRFHIVGPRERLRKKTALQGNGHSVRAPLGAELRKNVLHVRLHGGFGKVELIGNDLV